MLNQYFKKRWIALGVLFCFGLSLGASASLAHVTPLMKLRTPKEALTHLLPKGEMFLKEVDLTDQQIDYFNSLENWEAPKKHYKFFVVHGANYKMERSVIFMTEVTRHGAMVLAVALDKHGKVVEAMITALQTEIMGWVQPLLKKGFMNRFEGKDSSMELTLELEWTQNTNGLTQTYGRVISNAVKRSAQLFDQVFKK